MRKPIIKKIKKILDNEAEISHVVGRFKEQINPKWVGIKSTGEVGFVVREYDGGDRFSVMIIYNPKGDNAADAFRMVEKEDLTEVVDLEMIRMLYGSEEDKG